MERKMGRGKRPPTETGDLDAMLSDGLPDLGGGESANHDEGSEGATQVNLKAAAGDVEPFDPADLEGLTGDLPVQVVAVLGKKSIALRDVLKLQMGQVIDLGRTPSEIVDLVANGKLVAKGELVEIDGKLGVRIMKMMR